MRLCGARRSVVVVLLLAVSACATLPRSLSERTVLGRTVEGRLSVRYKDLQSTREESLTGRFVWTASADEAELSLLDPLGQTVALVRSDAERSSITFRDGRRVDGATPESLTQQTLGWTLPLRGLGWWLEGRSDPASESSTLADGRLRQDGWTIRFDAPRATSTMPPRRIDLSYPGPPVEVEMRLVVDQRSAP